MSKPLKTKQFRPLAAERFAQTKECGDEYFEFASLNLLHRASVEVSEFGEAFLCQATRIPLAANVRTEHSDFFGLDGLPWHAVMRREGAFREHGAMGRKNSLLCEARALIQSVHNEHPPLSSSPVIRGIPHDLCSVCRRLGR